MQPDQHQEPERYYTPIYRPPLCLNGIILALIGLCLWQMSRLWGSYEALVPLWLTLPIAGLGILTNFVLALQYFIRGRSRQAWPYLGGLLLLIVCLLGLLMLVLANVPHKIGG